MDLQGQTPGTDAWGFLHRKEILKPRLNPRRFVLLVIDGHTQSALQTYGLRGFAVQLSHELVGQCVHKRLRQVLLEQLLERRGPAAERAECELGQCRLVVGYKANMSLGRLVVRVEQLWTGVEQDPETRSGTLEFALGIKTACPSSEQGVHQHAFGLGPGRRFSA